MSKCARAQRGAQDRDVYFAKRFPSPAAQKENRKKHYGNRTGAAAKGREKGNSVALFSTPVMTWLGSEPIRHKYEKRSPAPRRRGLRLARDGFYFIRKPSHRLALPLLLLRKRSRSARLFACKRAHNGSLSLPTFCGKSRCQRSLQLLKGWQRRPFFDPSVTRGFAARATSSKAGEACTAPSP